MPKPALDGSGACVRCGSLDWTSATWIDGQGTVCGKCRPSRKRHHFAKTSAAEIIDELAQLLGMADEANDGPGHKLTQPEAAALYPGRLSPWYGDTPKPAAQPEHDDDNFHRSMAMHYRGHTAVVKLLASVRLPSGERLLARKITSKRVEIGCLGSVWECDTNDGKYWVSYGENGWSISRKPPVPR